MDYQMPRLDNHFKHWARDDFKTDYGSDFDLL